MAETSFLHLIGQHPILVALASQLSTLDLFHLGLASRYCHALILSSPELFSILKRQCLCDGRGFQRRLDSFLKGPRNYRKCYNGEREISCDEEIEMRLFTRRCDAAGALPCLRCGINICEECRCCPRTLSDYTPMLRPHISLSGELGNVMCLCPKCDDAMEDKLRGQFLSELCDCDIYRRWICRKCAWAECHETREYERNHTLHECRCRGENYDAFEAAYDTTKIMADHGWDVFFYCTCGSTVPDDMAPRCTWCKRRHRHDREWNTERDEIYRNIPPYVDEGGCYPQYSWTGYKTGYPTLGYRGPIYRNVDKSTEGDSKDR